MHLVVLCWLAMYRVEPWSCPPPLHQATGYKRCGAITVARTRDRMHALRRTASRNKAFGVACEVVGPDDCGRLWDPQGVGLMRTDDLQGGLWIPGGARRGAAACLLRARGVAYVVPCPRG